MMSQIICQFIFIIVNQELSRTTFGIEFKVGVFSRLECPYFSATDIIHD